MTDQPTVADQATTDPRATDQRTADQRTADQPARSEAPGTVSGTRELRDAQKASGQQRRPPIRATDGARTTASGTEARQNPPLFDEAAGRKLRERWLTIQTEFVDEPRDAVQKADALVAEVLKRLTDTFARERDELEAGWSRSGDAAKDEVSTEDLRQAIQRYRSFFNRLLSL